MPLYAGPSSNQYSFGSQHSSFSSQDPSDPSMTDTLDLGTCQQYFQPDCLCSLDSMTPSHYSTSAEDVGYWNGSHGSLPGDHQSWPDSASQVALFNSNIPSPGLIPETQMDLQTDLGPVHSPFENSHEVGDRRFGDVTLYPLTTAVQPQLTVFPGSIQLHDHQIGYMGTQVSAFRTNQNQVARQLPRVGSAGYNDQSYNTGPTHQQSFYSPPVNYEDYQFPITANSGVPSSGYQGTHQPSSMEVNLQSFCPNNYQAEDFNYFPSSGETEATQSYQDSTESGGPSLGNNQFSYSPEYSSQASQPDTPSPSPSRDISCHYPGCSSPPF
ncbi:hypothetical protein G7Y89_g15099 [Cudoniella acicularis]|uniref:Uncharacterized protein n=1 Tax=Cudoniella acicularis TaxID=354080 RepID=A0A8H4VND5_9HELO|nr:hypothetical protein G7Y89_g15099 [Cudoniella acicularis]